MGDPKIADLYLAFRQAKTALYFERRGVGLIELAQYEADLPANLAKLKGKLAKGAWFDDLDIGEVWIVPKRLEAPPEEKDVVRIGSIGQRKPRPLDVQVRLTPSPDLAVAEVLYLREFGPLLERVLSPNSIGYRLDLKRGELDPYRRWVFEYWPRRYQEFRTEPLKAAKVALAGGQGVLIVSADLASFYDSIDPKFLLSKAFCATLAAHGAFNERGYKKATTSLLAAIARFHRLATSRLGCPVTIGVPIGSLTSRVIANVALATMDEHIRSRPSVISYRRYVDDIVVVTKSDAEVTLGATLASLLPLIGAGDVFSLDTKHLQREGSELTLQRRKVKVHQLHGQPGKDFVRAVRKDFDRLVSKSQAFMDATTLLEDGASHLIRAGAGEGSPLRVLRDADRARLENFALSTSLRTLERASILVTASEAKSLVRKTLRRIESVLNEQDDWVDNLDVAIRLLRLAIGTNDWESCEKLNDRMEDVFGGVDSLQRHVSVLRYRGAVLPPERTMPWRWLRNYLHARRLEACASSIRLEVTPKDIARWLPNGLSLRTGVVKARAIALRAVALAFADLRSYDREDDHLDDRTNLQDAPKKPEWMERELPELAARLSRIRAFLDRCRELDDRAWLMPPARLFLCTRPPSYFDVARRLLYQTGGRGFRSHVFVDLLQVVNAIRGTAYQDPIGEVVDNCTVHIPWIDPRAPNSPQDPKLILGNLTIPLKYWDAAAKRTAAAPKGRPVLTVERLQDLSALLARASKVAEKKNRHGFVPPALLVLPELSVPRRWFRAVSSYIVKDGGFGAVIGLEYLHEPGKPYVLNQAHAVLPGPFSAAATWPWTKLRPADGEGIGLENLGLSFRPVTKERKRTVVTTSWGSFSTLICSELIETRRVADLLGRAELVLCPAWNTDTSSYDHLIQSVGFQLHAILAVANNGHYSDCRAWAPRAERWQRDLCRLIERDVDEIVYVDLPMRSLIAFHQIKSQPPAKKCRPGCEPKKAEWRPLPPHWPPHEN